jgi:zinc/manganese transport system permease protein
VLALGLCALGTLLVLRRMSLVGDAMAHAVLPGAAAGFLLAGLSLPAMSLGGFIAALAVAALAGWVTRSTPQREDASFAAFYLIALAAGVLLVSLRGSQVDLMRVLFGSILAVDDAALLLMAGTSATLLALAVVAAAAGGELRPRLPAQRWAARARCTTCCFLVLVVANLVAGFQALGTLMAVGLMMLPAASARFWAHGLPAMSAWPAPSGLERAMRACWCRITRLPSGPAIVLLAGAVYLSCRCCSAARQPAGPPARPRATHRMNAVLSRRVARPCRCALPTLGLGPARPANGRIVVASFSCWPTSCARWRRRVRRCSPGRRRCRRPCSNRGRRTPSGWPRPTWWSSTAWASRAGSTAWCVQASGYRGPVVVASQGITQRRMGRCRPACLAGLARAQRYVDNVRAALVERWPAQAAQVNSAPPPTRPSWPRWTPTCAVGWHRPARPCAASSRRTTPSATSADAYGLDFLRAARAGRHRRSRRPPTWRG